MFKIKYDHNGQPTIDGHVTSITQANHITLEGRIGLEVINKCAPPAANAYCASYDPRSNSTTVTYYLANVPHEIFKKEFEKRRKTSKLLRERLRQRQNVSVKTMMMQFTV